MYLDKLIIENNSGLIREIPFHKGLNLIVDETPIGNELTGNNVGKTTILRLIDFCLGGKAKQIYSENESRKEIPEVKEFLIETNVLVTLILREKFSDDSRIVRIERNFLDRKNAIRRINGKDILEKDFNMELANEIFQMTLTKPTFRQLISHSIRCDNLTLENTIRTLSSFSSDIDYETLHLFMFGCNFENGERKQELTSKISIESKYKERLEQELSKSALIAKLQFLQSTIETLNQKKEKMRFNPDFQKELDLLNEIKFEREKIASKYNSYLIRKKTIENTLESFKLAKSNIDEKQIADIYKQAHSLIPNLQKTFNDLLKFHNEMIDSKIRFVSSELPKIAEELLSCREMLEDLQTQESELNRSLSKSSSYEEIDKITIALNDKYREKGALEEKINLISEAENNIETLNNELSIIDTNLFSQEKKDYIQNQLNIFNKYFSKISSKLYDESYAIQFEIKKNKQGKPFYYFSIINLNSSAGKKKGESACFDLAYIKFADNNKIPCLHFVLNDKNELLHNNQLLQINEFLRKDNDEQFIVSFLHDKLPKELDDDKYIIIKLSQEDKLFRF